MTLTKERSAMLLNKLLEKLEDPGSISISCTIGNMEFAQALCDLGASVSLMPRSIFDKLGFGELSPTRISLQLADRSIRYPKGVLLNAPVRVENMWIPSDFVVIDMEEDDRIPIILERPFLATCGALIDMKNGKISLNIIDEKAVFDMNKAMQYPTEVNQACIMEGTQRMSYQATTRWTAGTVMRRS